MAEITEERQKSNRGRKPIGAGSADTRHITLDDDAWAGVQTVARFAIGEANVSGLMREIATRGKVDERGRLVLEPLAEVAP